MTDVLVLDGGSALSSFRLDKLGAGLFRMQ